MLAADAAPVEHPNRRRALEHGATVLALELAKERAAAEVERRLRGDLVEELLGHALERDEYARLAGQAERLGYRVSARSWVMVIEPDDPAAAQALESGSMQDRLHRLVSDLVTRRFPKSLVVTRSASLVLVIPVAEAEEEAPPAAAELRTLEIFGDLILQTIHRVVRDGTFSLGIGNATQEVHELPARPRRGAPVAAAGAARRRGQAGRVLPQPRRLPAPARGAEPAGPVALRRRDAGRAARCE